MIIYNDTTKVDWSIYELWLQWMREDIIPGILATNYFFDYRILRLLEIDETDGPTFAVQYFAHSLEECNKYINDHLTTRNRVETAKWGDKCTRFSTVMEVVN